MTRNPARRYADDDWWLRPVTTDDVSGLHAIGSKPLVYRYLFDGAVPDRDFLAHRVMQSIAHATETGFGMWLLENPANPYAGCVELRPYASPRGAELSYLLAPDYWRRGLAIRMAWTAITHGFRSRQIDTVIAGADAPNKASFAVMRRLGMRFHRDVHYPIGAGTEYVLHRHDAGPVPPPPLLPIH